MEHRCYAVLRERVPDRVVIGMRERATVDERRRDHREVHTRALEVGELAVHPLRVAQGEVRAGCTWPRPSVTTDAHQRFHAVCSR